MKKEKRQPYYRDTKTVNKDYQRLYVNKLDNLEEMDKFLETYKMSRLTKEETNNLNRLITSSEIEFVIKKKQLPSNKSRTLRLSRGILPNN